MKPSLVQQHLEPHAQRAHVLHSPQLRRPSRSSSIAPFPLSPLLLLLLLLLLFLFLFPLTILGITSGVVTVRVFCLIGRRGRCDVRKSHGGECVRDLAGCARGLLLLLHLFLRLHVRTRKVEVQGACEAAEEAQFAAAR